tara:strand:- start:298 stop:525 length:228 start_codon:yes stop_codon:yes gene_type:complete
MTIRDLVERLEEIENLTDGKPNKLCGTLIDDLIEFDMEIDKVMKKNFKQSFKEIEKDFLQHLIMDGIKSGSVGDA